MSNIFFNSQHSPLGAFASFTLGDKGAKGGLGLELGKPADQNVFIGLEDKDSENFSCLPFFEPTFDDSVRFDLGQLEGEKKKQVLTLTHFPDKKITRLFSPAVDLWEAGDISLTIHTPVMSAPDPARAGKAAARLAYVPALAVEIVVDNRKSAKSRRAIFGFQGNDLHRGMRRFDTANGKNFAGLAIGDSLAIASSSPGVIAGQNFTAEELLAEPLQFNNEGGLGGVGLLVARVPARQRVTLRLVVCFYRQGNATTGLSAQYHYTKFFPDIEAVASFALENFAAVKNRGAAFDRELARSPLNSSRKFLIAQAINSYYGSTQLLDVAGKPMWIVNEGEYRMMNTLDLTIDQLFFEMKQNPWTMRNQLDWFVKRYAYTDRLRLPGDDREYPGGLTFAHDMGITNHFSPPGLSSYEKTVRHGCFSHMSQEELVNWLVCALVYGHQAGDREWLRARKSIFQKGLESMVNRDHPDPSQRDGVMSLDSSRCGGGSEITTYDSLDVSLSQARNNLYLAVKCWGAYVGLADLFKRLKDPRRANLCRNQAALAAKTICASVESDGFLPAVLKENVASRLIPAIEGLIVPHSLGLRSALSPKGEYGDLIRALKRHIELVLKPGICLFPNGGWKLSSTSNNSFLSKIFLCQFITENILKISPSGMDKADQVHASWLQDPKNVYWAFSDQMISGLAHGSKYYPRGVTSVLWMKPSKKSRGKR